MKKIVFILIVFAFMSCHKTYDCVCTDTNSSNTVGTVSGTKRQAKKVCEEQLSSNTRTCKIH